MHFSIPGTDEKVLEMAGQLDDVFRGLKVNEKQLCALKLALDEAVTNAVKHGHACDPGKEVAVDCEWNPQAIVLSVTDQGPGFDYRRRRRNPTSHCNLLRDCGRGLHIISAIMSDVTFNDKGNKITMTLKRES